MSIDIAREMVTAGDQQITTLSGKIADIDQRIGDLTSELATLQHNAERRAASLVEARLNVVRTEGEHSQATSYAKLAQHKPNEQQAIKAVSAAKKAWDAAQKELTRLEKEDEEQRQVATAREVDISDRLHQLRTERETHESEIQSMQAGRDKALSELGAQTYAQITEGYRSKQQHIDELSTQLVAAQAELHDLYIQGLEQLTRWPDLHRAFAGLEVPDDAAVRVLETSLLYIETMLADMRDVNDRVPLPSLKSNSPVHSGYTGLINELLIHQGDVIAVLQRNPASLVQRRERFKRLLAEYRTYLQGQYKNLS